MRVVLVTSAVRTAAAGRAGVEFAAAGARRWKGLAEEVELFERRPSGVVETTPKLIDPVCGMELEALEVAARLPLKGAERAFCSEECLRRFMAAPHHYPE